jgi:hypothetical protein
VSKTKAKKKRAKVAKSGTSVGYETKEVAAAVVRFLTLLPDDFSTVAEHPADSELSQISYGLDDWAMHVLGVAGHTAAMDTSLLQAVAEEE